jgi:hypothetical protein
MGGKCSETQSLAAWQERGQTGSIEKESAPWMKNPNPLSLDDNKRA